LFPRQTSRISGVQDDFDKHVTNQQNQRDILAMNASEQAHLDEKPASGWACVALGVGFVAFLGVLIVAVRFLAG